MLATVLLLASAAAAHAATYTVSSGTDSGPGTLRAAIDAANATTTVDDQIVFSVTTVEPTSVLPAVTDTVTVDGAGGGCTGFGIVTLDGDSESFSGLRFVAGADGSRVCGMNVRGFEDGIRVLANDVTVDENRVGTDATGEAAEANSGAGIHVFGDDVTVTGNLVSGNTTGIEVDPDADPVAITGNLVGTDDDGLEDLGNGDGIVIDEDTGTTVGGTTAAARNVISGNSVGISAKSGRIVGNWIGSDATGDVALPNATGVWVTTPGAGVVVGGPTAAERNVISANTDQDVLLAETATVQGNWLGPSPSGDPLAPGGSGVNVTGGLATIEDNVISNHTAYGVLASGVGIADVVVRDNVIGRTPDGAGPLPNDFGIFLNGNFTDATVEGNTIAGGDVGILSITPETTIAGNTIVDHDERGVMVSGGPAALRANSITGSGGADATMLGIDIAGDGVTANDAGGGDADTGANDRQNFPVLTKAETDGSTTDVAGTIDTTPGRTITIEVFANAPCHPSGHGEGETFLGRAEIVAGSGPTAFSFAAAGTSAGRAITATATDEDVGVGQTSEFSECFTATQKPAPPADPPAPPVEETPAPPPPPPPPPPLITFPLPPAPKFPAKVAVLRNGVDDGVLDMLIQITSRSETPGAELELDYESSGKHTRFDVPITGTQIKVRKKLPKSQPKDTGIVEIEYDGNDAVSPDEVRLRAADGKSKLVRTKSEIEDGELAVEGTIAKEAEGVVRIRLEYSLPDGNTDFLYWNAKISNGRWKIAKALPALAAGGGQLSIQFTGYEKENLRGEQIAKQVLATG